jgi:hypothetical protein
LLGLVVYFHSLGGSLKCQINFKPEKTGWLRPSQNCVASSLLLIIHCPINIRVACGFPSSNARSAKNRAVGEHWSAKASSDQTHEILISPVIDDPVRVLGILVHELAHASTDGDGHKGRFPALVKALSLEGKPTATVEGEKFKAEYQPLLDDLGAYPHAKLNAGVNRKVQGTRMLKAACPDCGYTVRLSAKWASSRSA